MLIYEYKLDGTQAQYVAIDEAIRVVQFIRNKCLRLWMDRRGESSNDLQCYCAVLAKDYAFASRLNSQARQAAAGRAWFAIARFYDNCKKHKQGSKGYPKFQHDNRSVEYKTTGWKLFLMASVSPSPMVAALVACDWLGTQARRSKPFRSSKSSACELSFAQMVTTCNLASSQRYRWFTSCQEDRSVSI